MSSHVSLNVPHSVALSQEFEICSRIGKFSKGFSPTNKAFMMSSFRGGSIQMARISRRIAHNLLLNLDNSAPVCHLSSIHAVPN